MKAGTSSLYRYLASHPEVSASSIKETNFFIADARPGRDPQWYESLFESKAKWAFEASPAYAHRHLYPDVPGRMHALVPEVKLVYLVRDPVERTVSHYVHNYADGRESRSVSEAISEPNSNYVLTSKYFWQLQAFLERYPKEQLHVVESERLMEDPATVVEEVLHFAGISRAWDPAVLESRFNVSSTKKRRTLIERKFDEKVANPQLRSVLRGIARPFRRPCERPELSPADRDLLVGALGSEVEALRRFTGLALSSWSL